MNIGDPRELYKIDGFAQDFIEGCQNNCINHQKFIGPDDRFAFACKRTNVCCKNFSAEDRIILEPYDVLRLSRKLNISTQRFIHDFAELALDENTHFPIAFLTYKGKSRRNKCHFLRSYGCSVYEDRPLRCRLYPLGRLIDKGKSYFMLINNCPCGDFPSDSNWTADTWIKESKAADYLENQGFITNVMSYVDLDIYRALDIDLKIQLGKTLFNIDGFLSSIPIKSRPKTEKDIMLSLKYWLEGFFIEHGCLRPDYKTKRVIKFIGRPELKTETDKSSAKTPQELKANLINA